MLKEILFFIVLLIVNVGAATIYGSVYDFSLEKVENSIVTVNSTPKQQYIAKDGDYKFELSQGSYVIKAEYVKNLDKYSAEDVVVIKEDGNYVLDLILLEELNDNVEDIVVEKDLFEKKFDYALIVIIVVLVLLIIYFVLRLKKKGEKKIEKSFETKDDVEKVVRILKEEDGRMTQKDLRKRLNLSEAKVSLLIAELESKNIVEKIKKGRGNIIILK